MQTVAAAPDSPAALSASASTAVPAAALDSSASAPFLRGSYAESLGRPRGNPALPDDEWDDNATDEERFAAFDAAVQNGLDDIEAGRTIKIPAGRLRAFIRQIGDEARDRVRAKRAQQIVLQ